MLQGHTRHQVLPAFFEVAFDHHAGDAAVAAGDLRGDVGADVDLARMLLLGIGMREVDHHLLAQAALGERRAAIGVNLTKPTERLLRGTLAELRAELGSWEQVRGEMTLVVEGATAAPPELDSSVDDAIRALLAEGLGPRAIRDALAPVVDAPKATIYNRAVELSR